MCKCRLKYVIAQLENHQLSNLQHIDRLHFITLRTQIPTRHVLRTTRDVEETSLKAGGYRAPCDTTLGVLCGADSILQNLALDSPV